MEIVQLDQSTVNFLDKVAPDVFDNDLNPASVEAFVDCPRHSMLLAVENGLVIGMVSAVEYFHPDKQAQFWINEVAVTPDWQNKGLGKLLVNEMIALATERGSVNAWLGTEQTNLAANRCFSQVPNGNAPKTFVLYEWKLANQINAR